jgi:hypothetical protein
MPSTIKEWVFDLPPKHQSVLMTATRGPDEFRYPAVKEVNRWIRSVLFYDADPSNPFILKEGDRLPVHDGLLSELEHELEYLSLHYFGHFIHALEIIGYMHPDEGKRFIANYAYNYCCTQILHLPIEPEEWFRGRLG